MRGSKEKENEKSEQGFPVADLVRPTHFSAANEEWKEVRTRSLRCFFHIVSPKPVDQSLNRHKDVTEAISSYLSVQVGDQARIVGGFLDSVKSEYNCSIL